MIPIVKMMLADQPIPHDLLWWALSLGACLGGNLTLIGASAALYNAGMGELAVVVLITSLLGPALIISSSLYVLIGVRSGRILPGMRTMLSWIGHLEPWGMLDVFMLGVLVSFVKLAGMATIHIGISLYAFIGLIFVAAAAAAAFEPHLLWHKIGYRREVVNAGH